MSPCDPLALTNNVPATPGFGPFIPGLPSFALSFPTGFPEDLLGIFNSLQLLLPCGPMKPSLNLNFSKDIFDAIMDLLNKFMPFLMLYKFFLPILELIICIIEVLCAIPNPFKLAPALIKLFTVCLPNFLSLFPIFALILMIISLLLLILALIEYIILEILKIILLLLRNINVIVMAFTVADAPSILNALNKIGLVLCAFQNLFVLLAIFEIIIQTIKDILSLFFAIPPCDDGGNSQCCTVDVCPSFIKNNDGMQSSTGTFQYVSEVAQGLPAGTTLPSPFANLPLSTFSSDVRVESWQLYDAQATIPNAFWNITNAYDIAADGYAQTIFFPTAANYVDGTPPSQVPYTVDVTLFYDPSAWGRTDPKGARNLQVVGCIVLSAPTQNLIQYDNSTATVVNGVLELAGGMVQEMDGTEVFTSDGYNATLTNFFHMPVDLVTTSTPVLTPGKTFGNVSYTFHINYPVLIQNALITLGCLPSVSINRTFVNSVFGGNAGANYTALNNLINNTDPTKGAVFPDVGAAQSCLNTALTALRNNISTQGVAEFQAMTTACLNKLQSDTKSALGSLVGIGFSQYKSTFTIDPTLQFTSKSINVQVAVNETGGQPLTSGFPADIAADLAGKIEPTITFGTISDFVYDGYQFFNAQITSPTAGSGTIQISFDGQTISTATLPANATQTPTVVPLELSYQFVYSPTATDGLPRRDSGDIAREASNNGG